MGKMIQIRNVPEELHRALKARAASLGMTLSDYLLFEADQAMQRPTLDEFVQRLKSRRPTGAGDEPSWVGIRRHRDAF